MASNFERRLRRFGRTALHPDSLEFWQPLFKQLLDRFNYFAADRAKAQAPGHSVAIGFSEDCEYNAIARTDDEGDLIAISANVPVSLERAFNRALCFKSVMPFAGPLDEEHVDPEPVDPKDLVYGLNSNVPRIVPPNQIRSNLATLLTTIAMDFIFEHEMGHIWNGHTSFGNGLGISAYEEIEKTPDARISETEYQTLEMDADVFAGTAMTRERLLPQPWLPMIADWENKFGPGSTMLSLQMWAVYFSFRILDEAATLANVETRKHPPIYVRHFHVLGSWAAALSRRRGRDEKETYEMVRSITMGVEGAFACLTGREFDPAGITMAYSQEARDYIVVLLENWPRLRPQLDPLKRGGNLAPVTEL
ncbi:hypothetical protein ELH26_03900 [Rhizobium leguminosarum]|uniref:hypothetical protein n=1 Tax=Rhizobium leguminosarum TaxID=384 RepID=UPI00102F8363|nr:hypothetical protein [Rhizobium leguminosarum]TBC93222.1 hypothetical protein ELH26_03900 [Rhizobium leguminosarum]